MGRTVLVTGEQKLDKINIIKIHNTHAAPALTVCVSFIVGHVQKCHASRTQFHTSSHGNVKVESPSVCNSPFSSSPPAPHPPLSIVRPHALYQFLGKPVAAILR